MTGALETTVVDSYSQPVLVAGAQIVREELGS
jgi:hypothetical protein